jgi:hypothetical protein
MPPVRGRAGEPLRRRRDGQPRPLCQGAASPARVLTTRSGHAPNPARRRRQTNDCRRTGPAAPAVPKQELAVPHSLHSAPRLGRTRRTRAPRVPAPSVRRLASRSCRQEAADRTRRPPGASRPGAPASRAADRCAGRRTGRGDSPSRCARVVPWSPTWASRGEDLRERGAVGARFGASRCSGAGRGRALDGPVTGLARGRSPDVHDQTSRQLAGLLLSGGERAPGSCLGVYCPREGGRWAGTRSAGSSGSGRRS